MNIDQGFIEYEYKGFGIHDSKCNIHFKKVGDFTFILFEDIDQGTSVTNASEQLATEVVNKFDLNPEKCRFFETYRKYGEDVDEITYDWSMISKSTKLAWKAQKPQWKHQDNTYLELFIK